MNGSNLYMAASTLALFLLGVNWSSSRWPNFWLKVGFLLLSIWGLLTTLMAYGFMFRGRP